MSQLVTFPLNSNEKVEDLLLDQGFSNIESCCSGGGGAKKIFCSSWSAVSNGKPVGTRYQ
jgi:hypothetical protein